MKLSHAKNARVPRPFFKDKHLEIITLTNERKRLIGWQCTYKGSTKQFTDPVKHNLTKCWQAMERWLEKQD